MDLARIISELRSEREEIDQAILSVERSDPLNTPKPQGAAQPITDFSRARKVHPRIISELRSMPSDHRWERAYIEQAILCLERLDRLSTRRTQAAKG